MKPKELQTLTENRQTEALLLILAAHSMSNPINTTISAGN